MNEQAPWRVDRKDDGSLAVHSIFETIQGEGPFAGTPAIFVRLAGCNLQCPGCDTEYTSVNVRFGVMYLMREIKQHGEHWPLVVITGGEPFRQNITPFVRELLRDHPTRKVQIETNGVLGPGPDDAFPWDHARLTVVCSPKTGQLHPRIAPRVHAYKYVLSWDSMGPDGLPEMALAHPLGGFNRVARPPMGWVGPVYLQPMDSQDPSVNDKNIQACVRSVLNSKGRYTLGVQMHKLTGLP